MVFILHKNDMFDYSLKVISVKDAYRDNLFSSTLLFECTYFVYRIYLLKPWLCIKHMCSYLECLLSASMLKFFPIFPKRLFFILCYLNVIIMFLTLEINELKWSRDRKFFLWKIITTNLYYAPIQLYYSLANSS